jgi:hypothetical protein
VSAQGNSRGAVRLVAEIAAVLSFGAGVVHVSAAGDHTEVPILFAGFIVVAVLQVALGARLLWRRPSRPLVAAGLALMVGSIGVWLVSRTVGLPFPEDGHQEPVGFKDGVTVLFELGAIPPLLMLLSRDLDHVSLPSSRLAGQTLRAVSAMCCVMLVPALTLGGGEHHSHDEAVALGFHDGADAHGVTEGHARAKEHTETRHETADDHRRKGRGHGDPSGRSGDGHSGHTLASASPVSDHEHEGGSGPGTPRHHARDEGKQHHRGGGGHGDHEKRDGRRGGKHDGGHGGGHGEDGGGEGDEPPVTITYEPLTVCVSGVCAP